MTIFEKIIAREIPAYIVYEDDLSIAFLDISQITKGHTLVVPKKAYPNILEIPTDLLMHLMGVVKKICSGLNQAYGISEFNILNNNGQTAGQTVFHYHIHVLPRFNQEEFKYQHQSNNYSKDELLEITEKIKGAL